MLHFTCRQWSLLVASSAHIATALLPTASQETQSSGDLKSRVERLGNRLFDEAHSHLRKKLAHKLDHIRSMKHFSAKKSLGQAVLQAYNKLPDETKITYHVGWTSTDGAPQLIARARFWAGALSRTQQITRTVKTALTFQDRQTDSDDHIEDLLSCTKNRKYRLN